MNGTGTPLVSIVIPCFNHAAFLGQAIESVLAQTWRPVEVTVVDDGSTDDSARVALSFAGINVIRQKNMGLARARNAGLRQSRGGLVLFLDADDALVPDGVELLVRAFNQVPEAGYVAGLCRMMSQAGAPMARVQGTVEAGPGEVRELEECQTWMPGTVLYRRGVLDEVGEFEREAAPCEDYDMYSRIARRFPVFELGTVVGYYRDAGVMSSNRRAMLRGTSVVLRRHCRAAHTSFRDRSQWTKGIESVRDYYAMIVAGQTDAHWLAGRWMQAARFAGTLVRHAPGKLSMVLGATESNRAVFVVGSGPGDSRVEPPKGSRGPVLESLHPDWTRPGEGFNVQPDGSSAVAIRCRGATPATAVVIGRTRLQTTFSDETLVTATVPRELFAHEGRYEVYLRRLESR